MPSSARLGAVLTEIVPRDGAPVVVELGPGTGAVSRQIERRLPPSGRHLAVELDPVMAASLRRWRPGIQVIEGDAADLDDILAQRVTQPVDAVVSSLPWSLFDARQQATTLAAVSRAIGPTGAFSTFAYLHGLPLTGARRFRHLLRRVFDEVVRTAPVWTNVPPAEVYVCRRPRRADGGVLED